jgi:hypothetical protein
LHQSHACLNYHTWLLISAGVWTVEHVPIQLGEGLELDCGLTSLFALQCGSTSEFDPLPNALLQVQHCAFQFSASVEVSGYASELTSLCLHIFDEFLLLPVGTVFVLITCLHITESWMKSGRT